MPDLFEALPGESRQDHHWFSLVGASPSPESGESVNVAVVFGNGRAYGLRYLHRLPRLAGIAAADEVNVYEAVLHHVAEQIDRGAPLDLLRPMLAPQMLVSEPKALHRMPDDELMESIVASYLSAPKEPERTVNLEALIRKSTARLQSQIEQLQIKGLMVQQNVRPHNLFAGKLDRVVPFRVPKLARALRGFSRDVLVDSLVIESSQDRGTIRMATARIGEAFFAYDAKLKHLVRAHTRRELRTVGVLHPGSRDDSADIQALRDYIRDHWSKHATVIDGNEQDVVAALREHGEWAVEAA
jgi:hypothetical protein